MNANALAACTTHGLNIAILARCAAARRPLFGMFVLQKSNECRGILCYGGDLVRSRGRLQPNAARLTFEKRSTDG